MALVTTNDLRAMGIIGTDSATDYLAETVLASEEAEIVRRYGLHDTATVTLYGGSRLLMLARPAASVTTVVEGVETLTVDDHYTFIAPYLLERVSANWGERVTITYVPKDTNAQRTMVLINLVKLALAFSGYSRESFDGVSSEQPLDYTEQREALLSSLSPVTFGFV